MAGKNLIMTGVVERDVDLLLIRTFMENQEYLNGFLADLGISGRFELDKARSSLSDDMNEVDITLIITDGEVWHGVLIENMIDGSAALQPAESYLRMAEDGVRDGVYDEYTIVLIAPEKCLAKNPESEAYPHKVTYERLRSFFRVKSFEYQVITRAIEKRGDSFVEDESAAHAAFWASMRDHVETGYPQLRMGGSRGDGQESRAKWCSFELEGDREMRILFKADRCFVDLEIPDLKYERFMRDNQEFLRQYPYVTVKKGDKGLSLRMLTLRPVDFGQPFERQLEVVTEALNEVVFLLERILPGLKM